MWLLDHSLPHIFYQVLASHKIPCQTASYAKVGHLENGVLTQTIIDMGFTAILTRDKSFPDEAREVLVKYPNFSVVIIKFEQSPRTTLKVRLEEALARHGMMAIKSGVTLWPIDGSRF